MRTTWNNYKTLAAARRQAERNKERGNAWCLVLRCRATGLYALHTAPHPLFGDVVFRA